MARLLALDWDRHEARFVLGTTSGGKVNVHAVQAVPLVLLLVVQLPEVLQTGFLHGSEVMQVSQLSPLSPQSLMVSPGLQTLPSQQPQQRPFWMH